MGKAVARQAIRRRVRKQVQRKRRVADIYIGNLALADLVISVTLPFGVVCVAMDQHWPFGAALCKIISYVETLSTFASIFLLTSISFDRYQAIVHSLPSNHLCTGGHIGASLFAAWTLSGLLSVPALVFRTTQQDLSSNRTFCTLDFSLVVSNRHQESQWFSGLNLSMCTLGFLLPLLAMMVCYGLIGWTVMRHFHIWRKEDQRKWRLLKITITVVVVFVACWIPYHVVISTGAMYELHLIPITCAFERFLLLVSPYTVCLAYINSCLNPFLNAFFDLHFRSHCLGLLHLKKFRQTPTKV
ncbi:apelin receptor B-like [Hippocampus comes]|uniref:apelin receptor B-like n=1 Tax=Hippocampus comes TaxID=109280 RepID=UPI00094E02D9|nr:PREDICTED: apelin receptor B-like [Hippocampus comes]